MFTPRPYQVEAITAGVDFFKNPPGYHGFEILPTGSGKSVVIANIAKELEGGVAVFQPSKEILIQNHAKFTSYGYRAGIYSASAGQKKIEPVTFVTIGSVAAKPHLFKQFKYFIVDECHGVNAESGMYYDFFNRNAHAPILGLTATPYRLTADFEGAQLRFLNRTTPRIFKKVLYYIQNNVLFDAGHLSKLEYYSFDVVNRSELQMNKSGTDFTDASVKAYYRKINMPNVVIQYAKALLAERKNLLTFCSLISEAKEVCRGVPGSVLLTGETEQSVRDNVLAKFKAGTIKHLVNVGVLTTGFDYPELECVLLARSTMSLALYYQIFGRGMRPHPNKESCWLVDLGGNIDFFGKIETMQIVNKNGYFSIWNNNRQLTDVSFVKS